MDPRGGGNRVEPGNETAHVVHKFLGREHGRRKLGQKVDEFTLVEPGDQGFAGFGQEERDELRPLPGVGGLGGQHLHKLSWRRCEGDPRGEHLAKQLWLRALAEPHAFRSRRPERSEQGRHLLRPVGREYAERIARLVGQAAPGDIHREVPGFLRGTRPIEEPVFHNPRGKGVILRVRRGGSRFGHEYAGHEAVAATRLQAASIAARS